ncbi:hypothetical protein B0H17DRAFT_1048653, partial [Mycena rosella]
MRRSETISNWPEWLTSAMHKFQIALPPPWQPTPSSRTQLGPPLLPSRKRQRF